jgi:uncharacterized protein (TIGR00266 family)
MEHSIAHGPTFTTLTVRCAAGEIVRTQPDSMLCMSPGFEVKAELGTQMVGKDKVGKAFRSFFAGESFFTAVYTAKRDEQFIELAPKEIGEIRQLDTSADQGWLLSSGAYLASLGDVLFELKYAGVKGLFAMRGLFFMRTVGQGTVFVASYGAVIERELAVDERFVIDNRNVLAFTDGMNFESVSVTKSVRHAYFSGEGFVVRFTGPGKVLYQTRARPSAGLLRGLVNTIT